MAYDEGPGPQWRTAPWPSAAPGVAKDWPSAPNELPHGWGADRPSWPEAGPGEAPANGGAGPRLGQDVSFGLPLLPDRPQVSHRLPARAAWWALAGAGLAIVLAGVGEAIGQAVTGSTTAALTELLGELGLWAAMLGTAVLVSRRYGTSSLRLDYGLVVKRRDIFLGFLGALVALVVAEAVTLPFAGTKFAGSNDQLLTQQQGHEVGFVIVALIVAVGAPFFEELFFRGFLRTCLQARFGGHGAVWVQACLFGFAHLGEVNGWANVSVVLALSSVGVVLGYLAMLSKRLGPGMFAHGLFNLAAVISVL